MYRIKELNLLSWIKDTDKVLLIEKLIKHEIDINIEVSPLFYCKMQISKFWERKTHLFAPNH
jgi:hypothetical protein